MARKYWQIAAESKGREYADEFILFGMAFVGGNDQCATMATVDAGDVILLKRGLSKVVAVGEVVERNGKHGGDGDKQWLRDFDGWIYVATATLTGGSPKILLGRKGSPAPPSSKSFNLSTRLSVISFFNCLSSRSLPNRRKQRRHR